MNLRLTAFSILAASGVSVQGIDIRSAGLTFGYKSGPPAANLSLDGTRIGLSVDFGISGLIPRLPIPAMPTRSVLTALKFC